VKARPEDQDFRRLFVHGIGDAALASFGGSSKMNNHPEFLRHLHHLGERAAEQWLAENRDNVGNRSTVDLSGLVPTRHASLITPSNNKRKHKVQK
jgi:NTE family protein